MYDKVINDLKEENTNKHKLNLGLDPELDLRNVNFATGENHYLSENVNEEYTGR
ncbi:hypothetical protein IM538_20070 [Cytobacillus suaedae]|nr:hypothetical protein IM538_20070 [Cytobacillus suaedae]